MVEGSLYASLGDGDNELTVAGEIGRELDFRGGLDDDTVTLLATALVGRSASICLGDGENTLRVEGTVEKNLVVHGGDGNDTVEVAATGEIGRSAKILLGDGENSLNHSGSIEGNLTVRSSNENDEVSTSNGTVGGETHVQLGEDTLRPRHSGFGFGFVDFWSFGRRAFGWGVR